MIVLFNSITTEEALKSIEAESLKSAEGLYVDMSELEGRNFVRDESKKIKDLLKSLDAKRKDINKAHTLKVNSEAEAIKLRLEKANKPYTLLEDEWKAERKKVLDAEKEKEALKQLEEDHELALLLNMKWDSEKEQRDAERKAQQDAIEKVAADKAIAEYKRQEEMKASLQKAEDAYRVDEQERKANDINRQHEVKNLAAANLIEFGIDKETAIKVIKLIAANKVANVQINY